MTDAVTYVGHATLLAELGGARVLTDPLIRGGLGHIRRRAAPPDPDVVILRRSTVSRASRRSMRPRMGVTRP